MCCIPLVEDSTSRSGIPLVEWGARRVGHPAHKVSLHTRMLATPRRLNTVSQWPPTLQPYSIYSQDFKTRQSYIAKNKNKNLEPKKIVNILSLSNKVIATSSYPLLMPPYPFHSYQLSQISRPFAHGQSGPAESKFQTFRSPSLHLHSVPEH